jgi:hypothetical protein
MTAWPGFSFEQAMWTCRLTSIRPRYRNPPIARRRVRLDASRPAAGGKHSLRLGVNCLEILPAVGVTSMARPAAMHRPSQSRESLWSSYRGNGA